MELLLSLLFCSFFLLRPASPLKETARKPCSSLQDYEQQIFNSSGGLHLPLHHIHGPCSPVRLPPAAVSDILKSDEARIQSLQRRLSGTRGTTHPASPSGDLRPESLDVPLKSGLSVGVGNYVVKLGLGTPPKYLTTVVDTGSSLNWVQCEPCVVYCHSQAGPRFDPAASSTYASLPCNSADCAGLQSATLNPPACSKANKCIYQASYGDSSFSVGFLGKDTLTLSPSATLPGFVYGCGQDNEGLFGLSAGLLGLSRNRLSLFGQLSPKYGGVFSYCLPTASSTGSLSIGRSAFQPSLYKFTPLYTLPNEKTLYSLRLASITVAGAALPLAAAEYTRLPMIIDSGTVITRLPQAVYSALKAAFVRAMKGYRAADPVSILDTCFEGSSGRMAVPEVRLVYAGGAAMVLAARNTIIEVDSGVSCLAFAAASHGVAIIGNRQQQTFRIAYDVENSRIGFAAGGCR